MTRFLATASTKITALIIQARKTTITTAVIAQRTTLAPMRLSTTLPLLPLAAALPTAHPDANAKPLPLLIWHGLGDRYDADGIADVAALANELHPGTLVYPIRVASDGSADSRATFFGNLTSQINDVCTTLSSNTSFSANNTRIDALGFSQGGQFLRGLVERCPGIQVRSLVTFGSQHNGIAKFQNCGTWDLVCKGAMAAIKGNAFGDWVQGNIIPAQYYKEVNATTGNPTTEYLEKSNFIADINNERANKTKEYKHRLARLDNFAMYVFEDDKTVIPKESGWFSEVNTTSLEVTALRDREIYQQDWIGLKVLDQKGALVFRNASGGHMDLSEKVLTEAFLDFFGPERKSLVEEVKEEVDQVMEKVRQGAQMVFEEL
ncbi:palmitoyl-protein thioesterase 1 precursor [Aureobasidium pullulans]|nr:palmitoyl-protein thioesterase 1 precursor [Aureobasidium pullulans]